MFFKELISFISNNNGRNTIFIDSENVTEISIDALMYLLALLNNANLVKSKNVSIAGNIPRDKNAKRIFIESGFFKYVHYTGKRITSRNNDNIQIVNGNNSDPFTARKVSDFVCERVGISPRKCDFLYIMLIELMSNTCKHAYNDSNNLFEPNWYCFIEYSKSIITFTFMDTGEGIPATVRKNFTEKVDFLGIKGDDKYVVSALNGEFRSSTRQFNRGKGLPKIKDFCDDEKIQNMRIITNKADVTVLKNRIQSYTIKTPLQGTLYYWQIDINKLKGAI